MNRTIVKLLDRMGAADDKRTLTSNRVGISIDTDEDPDTVFFSVANEHGTFILKLSIKEFMELKQFLNEFGTMEDIKKD